MAIPTAPNNFNDFMSQASSFVSKAREKGVDDNKIANTIKFMYGLTQQNMAATKEKDTGTIAYNSDTGEYYNTMPGGSADVGTYQAAGTNGNSDITGSDFGFGPNQNTSTSTTTQNDATDFSSLEELEKLDFSSKETASSNQEKPKTTTNYPPLSTSGTINPGALQGSQMQSIANGGFAVAPQVVEQPKPTLAFPAGYGPNANQSSALSLGSNMPLIKYTGM